MSLPRPLAALLIAALVLSSSPAAALAGSNAPAVQQAPSVAPVLTYLLIVKPPPVIVPPGANAFDAAGHVNVEHARHYAAVAAQLESLRAEGAIAGYSAQPAAYAFVVNGASAGALAALGALGQLQAQAEMSASAVDALAAAYRSQLSAAIASSVLPGRTDAASVEGMTLPAPAGQLQPAPDKQRQSQAAAIPLDVAAVKTPVFEVYLDGSYIWAGDVASGTPITVTLKTATGVIKGQGSIPAATGSDRVVLTDVYGNQAKIAAGDVVEVQAPTLVTIPVVNLQAVPNVAARRVSGFGPPSITSTVESVLPNLWLGNSGYVTTTETGSFTARTLIMDPGDYWWLTYTNEQGNSVTLNWGVPNLAARGHAGPYETGYIADSTVSGRMVKVNAPITVTLTRPGSQAITNIVRTDEYAYFELSLRDQYGNLAPILAGDQVQVADGLATSTVDIPGFDVTSDPVADTLAGITNAPVTTNTAGLAQTLSLWPMHLDESGYGRTVLTSGESFSAANPFYLQADASLRVETLDWGPGQRGHLRYLDARGNAVFASFRAATTAPLLALRSRFGSYAHNYVTGDLNGECVTGAVVLLDAGGGIKAQTNVNACDSFAAAFVDVYDNPVPILSGDFVRTLFGEQTTTVRAPGLALVADPQRDLVFGRIDAGLVTTTTFGAPQSLVIRAGRTSINVQPDAAGDFRADFADITNIEPGATGKAVYIDAAGNEVLAQWEAPFDQPTLSLRGRRFEGYRADNFVAVYLQQSVCDATRPLDLAVRAQDGTLRWQGALPVCGAAVEVYLEDAFGNNIDLNGGDQVQATFGGQTAAITVPTFTNLLSDHRTDVVSGVTVAEVMTTAVGLTQTLAVWPISLLEDNAYGKQVQVATGGVFSATNPSYYQANPGYGSLDLDWDAGARGHLRYIDAGGNHVYTAFAALPTVARLVVYKGENRVEGKIPAAGAPVTVTLLSGATVKAVNYAVSTLYGEFEVAFFDRSGNPVAIAEGDQVILAEPAAMADVPALSATADVENDRITGRGPANALLNVVLDGSDNLPVATDPSGAYTLDVRGIVDLEAGDWVSVEYKTADGHAIRLQRPAGAMLSATLANNRVWGYAPVDSAQEAAITVTVKRRGALVGKDSFTGSGNFTAYPVDATGKPLILRAGDQVELDLGGGVIKSLTLAPLTLVANEAANTLTGSGPVASRLAVEVDAEPIPYNGTVLTDAAGWWGIDLNTLGRDMQPGDMATVRYSDNGVDATWLYGVAPVFWLRVGGENRVHGYAVPYAPVTVALKRDGAVPALAFATAADDGAYAVSLRDVNGLNADILPGDVVEVTSASAVSVTVPVLQLALDAVALTVSGIGPPNSSLGLITNAGNRTVKTDASGAFFTSFAGQTSVLNSAALYYREPRGNWIVSNTVQQTGGPAYLVVRHNGAYHPAAVSGSTGAGLRPVELSLHRGKRLVASAYAWTDASGGFTAFFRNAAATVDILPGDVIDMVAGDVQKSLTVPPLTVQANLLSRTLYGSGPPNAALWSPDCGSTVVDPAGAWTIECSGSLGHGDSGYVYVTDLLGNSTWLGWSTPGVRVRQNGNSLAGTVGLGQTVRIRLQRETEILAETNVTASEGNGSFAAQLFDENGSPLLIQPGDEVLIDAGQQITVPVGPLAATVNVVADRVTGMGPAGSELHVHAWNAGGDATRLVQTGSDGGYTADFSGALDLRGGGWVEVEHVNAEGHAVWLGLYAPLVRINLSNDVVDGYATPNAIASLVLKRGGVAMATTKTATAEGGSFSAFFVDKAGGLIDLIAGDVVEVTASPTVATAAIALTTSLDQDANQVRGSAPAGTMLLVVAWRCGATGCYSREMTTVAAADGVYSADFSRGFDLDQTSYAYVQAADAAGNQTSTTTQPVETPQLRSLEVNVVEQGALLLASGAGTANPGNLTPPMPVTVLAAGRIIFMAQGGSPVVTAPNGMVLRVDGSRLVVQNTVPGIWQVQVAVSGGVGAQYAVAAGLSQYTVHMPIIALNTSQDE